MTILITCIIETIAIAVSIYFYTKYKATGKKNGWLSKEYCRFDTCALIAALLIPGCGFIAHGIASNTLGAIISGGIIVFIYAVLAIRSVLVFRNAFHSRA